TEYGHNIRFLRKIFPPGAPGHRNTGLSPCWQERLYRKDSVRPSSTWRVNHRFRPGFALKAGMHLLTFSYSRIQLRISRSLSRFLQMFNPLNSITMEPKEPKSQGKMSGEVSRENLGNLTPPMKHAPSVQPNNPGNAI